MSLSLAAVGKTLGTVLAGTGLLLGAATGVQALAGAEDTPAPAAACVKHESAKQPQALRDAVKKAKTLPKGAQRSAARAAIRKDVLAGKYGAAMKARAEKARDKRLAGLPAALRSEIEKLAAMPQGKTRREAWQKVHSDVLAGKYGAEVKQKAEAKKAERAADRKARAAATTPALKSARQKIRTMDEGATRDKAKKDLAAAVLAGKYGDAAKSYAEKQKSERAEARKAKQAKAKERQQQHREACAAQKKSDKKADEKSDDKG